MTVSSPRLFFFVNLVKLTIAKPEFLYHFCIKDKGNSANSTYQGNLNALLSSVSSNAEIDYGFYNSSAGQNSDAVNAIALCRGDVKLDACRSCINDSRHELRQRCPNQKEAIGWYDNCMLRHSNRSIFGTTEVYSRFYVSNRNSISSMNQFNQALKDLLDGLKNKAKSGRSLQKFTTGNTSGPDFKALDALVQCTPDLSKLDCNDCLDTREIPDCYDGKEGGIVVAPSCNLMYDIYHFYDRGAVDELTRTSPAPLLTSLPPQSDSDGSSTIKGIPVHTASDSDNNFLLFLC